MQKKPEKHGKGINEKAKVAKLHRYFFYGCFTGHLNTESFSF